MSLTAQKVKTAGPGRHGDGRGLFLFVKPSGARSWVLRYQVMGKRHDLGLGAYPEVSGLEDTLAFWNSRLDALDVYLKRQKEDGT